MEEDSTTEFAYQCQECQAGIRYLKHLTYFTWLDNQLITVPNFPTWVCDLCGRSDYDVRAVSWLDSLLKSPRKKSPTQLKHRKGSPTGLKPGVY